MDDKRKSFTFIWKIKNFSFSNSSSSEEFVSPNFIVHEMCRTVWILVLKTKSKDFYDCVECSLMNPFYGGDEFKFDCELAFLTGDGSVMHSEKFLNAVLLKRGFNTNAAIRVKSDEVFVHKKHLFLPDDTLTVRCRMWKSQGSISQSARCSVVTRIITQCRPFVGTIEKFSSLNKSSKNVVLFKSSEKDFIPSSINLCISDDGKLHIEMKIVYEPYTTCKFKVLILDVYGNKVKTCQGDICNNPLFIPLTFSRDHLIKNKEYYIPNDVLTLHCEVVFLRCMPGLPNILEITDDMLYEYDCQQDIQPVISNATNTNPSSVEDHTESLTTMRDDFISLYKEGILSDTKLKTATETFPAHAAVLSARSPVFKSMFATDMREKTNNCVDIEDMDADTVRQMLLFMYSDTLDDLDYGRAKSLYFAADKYSIVSLRHRCANFLKQNILYSNCCDILLLADRHQDKDLKRSVQDCIAENDEAVFSSDEWKNLVESQPRLTTEILFAVYMKNRRT